MVEFLDAEEKSVSLCFLPRYLLELTARGFCTPRLIGLGLECFRLARNELCKWAGLRLRAFSCWAFMGPIHSADTVIHKGNFGRPTFGLINRIWVMSNTIICPKKKKRKQLIDILSYFVFKYIMSFLRLYLFCHYHYTLIFIKVNFQFFLTNLEMTIDD